MYEAAVSKDCKYDINGLRKCIMVEFSDFGRISYNLQTSKISQSE